MSEISEEDAQAVLADVIEDIVVALENAHESIGFKTEFAFPATATLQDVLDVLDKNNPQHQILHEKLINRIHHVDMNNTILNHENAIDEAKLKIFLNTIPIQHMISLMVAANIFLLPVSLNTDDEVPQSPNSVALPHKDIKEECMEHSVEIIKPTPLKRCQSIVESVINKTVEQIPECTNFKQSFSSAFKKYSNSSMLQGRNENVGLENSKPISASSVIVHTSSSLPCTSPIIDAELQEPLIRDSSPLSGLFTLHEEESDNLLDRQRLDDVLHPNRNDDTIIDIEDIEPSNGSSSNDLLMRNQDVLNNCYETVFNALQFASSHTNQPIEVVCRNVVEKIREKYFRLPQSLSPKCPNTELVENQCKTNLMPGTAEADHQKKEDTSTESLSSTTPASQHSPVPTSTEPVIVKNTDATTEVLPKKRRKRGIAELETTLIFPEKMLPPEGSYVETSRGRHSMIVNRLPSKNLFEGDDNKFSEKILRRRRTHYDDDDRPFYP